MQVTHSGFSTYRLGEGPVEPFGFQTGPEGLAAIEVRHVIDGQQRLTTLQLLLDAAQEVFEDDGFDREAKLLRRLVQNETDQGDPVHNVLKVWPTLVDRDAFTAAMMNDLSTAGFEESPIVQAHEFFKLQLREWLEQDTSVARIRAYAVAIALMGLFQVVVIDLASADDANVIFETLNARGTPLLDSELIKNSLLHLARMQGFNPDVLYRAYWAHFDAGWWRQEKRQGRLVRPRIDVYLHYWLTMRRAEEIPSSEVFSTFRKAFVDANLPVEGVLSEIRSAGDSFKELEDTEDWSIQGTFLYRWRIMDAGTASPLLLWLLTNRSKHGKQSFEKALQAIESYLVRRMVCRMTTKDYNHLFLELVALLHQQALQALMDVGDVVVDFLRGQRILAYGPPMPSSVMPS